MAAMGPLSRGARTRRRWLVCVIAVLAALIASSAPASATIIERYRSTQTYDEVRWDCGYPMKVVGVETHKVQVRADKKLDGNAYVTDNYDFKEVWTAADGRSFTLTANALAKDVKAKSVDGSVYEFTFNNPGQPFTITDSSGSRRLPRPGEPLVPLHDRPRRRHVQLPWGQGVGTSSRFRRRHCARPSHR